MTTEEARVVLGVLAKDMTDVEIERLVILYESLANAWLDQYERSKFKGLTLKEILTQKEGHGILWT